MARLLNLFNGDCAESAWRQCHLPGEALVWRENYLQGVLPETDCIKEFHAIRAAELHNGAPEQSAATIFADLERMTGELFALTAADTLLLWFDQCPFDRTMLARILNVAFSIMLIKIQIVYRLIPHNIFTIF